MRTQGRSALLFIALAIGAALAVPSGALAAAAGDLDPSFDGDGRLTTSFGTTPFHPADTANGGARGPGGEIYVAGESDDDFALVRFTAAGVLDTTFGGGDGIVITSVGGSNSQDGANAVSVDGSGRIVVAGSARPQGDNRTFAVVRYTSSGALDATFGGGDGIVTTAFPLSEGDEARGVAHLAGGNIVVAGEADADPDPDVYDGDFALAVYTTAGSLDSSFDGDGGSGNGLVTTDFGSDDEGANAVLVAAGPKILVAGTTDPPGDDRGDFAVARYDAASGVKDTTFDTDGEATYSFSTNPASPPSNGDHGLALATAALGKIVVAGSAGPQNGDFAVIRVDDAGLPDGTFGTAGKTVLAFPPSTSPDRVRAVAVQTDDKVLLAGETAGPGNGAFNVTRLTTGGVADGTFGTGGTVITDFAPANGGDGATGLFIDATTITATGTGDEDFAAARYLIADGAVDTTFGGGDGKVDSDVPHPLPSSETAQAAVLQPDGKLVVVGPTDVGAINDVKGEFEFGLARYNADGSLDAGFGAGGVDGNGRVSTNFITNPDGTGSEDTPEAVALQSDGKIVVVGGDAPEAIAEGDFAIARYEPDGDLDPTFNGTGTLTQDFAGVTGDMARGVAIQGDPGEPGFRIVVVGSKRGTSDIDEQVVAVYNDDGTPDTSFGGGTGTTTIDIPGYNVDTPKDVAIQADGRIVVAGSAGGFEFFPTPYDFSVVRYEPDGDPDPTFGAGDGIVTTDFVGGYDQAEAVEIDELGSGQVRIVASGRAAPDVGFTADGGLAAYTTDGSLDPTFAPGGADGDGKATLDLQAPFEGDSLRGLALQPDGKIVASGSMEAPAFGVMRANPAGSLDPTFGGDGVASTDFGLSGLSAFDIALQADGRVVAVGGVYPQAGSDFVLARYFGADQPVTNPPAQPPAPAPKAKKCKKKKAKKKAAGAAKKCKKKKKKK